MRKFRSFGAFLMLMVLSLFIIPLVSAPSGAVPVGTAELGGDSPGVIVLHTLEDLGSLKISFSATPAWADPDETREETGTSVADKIGKKGSYVLLILVLGAVGLLIFTKRKRKKAGQPAKLDDVVGDLFNGGVDDFINAGKELLDKEWREAKEAVGDGLDDIDKKWDEGMALIKKTADRMTEKQNK